MDNPVIALGLPPVVLAAKRVACGGAGTVWSSGVHLAALVALAAVSWAFGCLYLWVVKWVFAILVTDQGVFSNAFGQAAIYSGGSAESKGSVLDAASLNVQALGFVGYALLVASALLSSNVFLAVYFAMPWRSVKNVVLLFSLLFYAWGEPVYVFLMIGSIVTNWLMALLIDRFQEKGSRMGALVVALVVNIGILGLFKYETFVATNVNLALGEEFLIDLQLALPIGISFFTL